MWSSQDNFDTKIGNCMRNIAIFNKANKRNSTNIDAEDCKDFCISFWVLTCSGVRAINDTEVQIQRCDNNRYETESSSSLVSFPVNFAKFS